MDWVYVSIQIGHFFVMVVIIYLLMKKVRYVNPEELAQVNEYPPLVLFYPLLREDKDTIYTTLLGHQKMDYPSDRWRMIAVTNWFDTKTSDDIKAFMREFPFLDLIVVPPCDDPTWNIVWRAWANNSYCYWWHKSKTRYNRDLPPKKTRQLIYAFYQVNRQTNGEDWILNYIDADSVSPTNHFKLGVAGLQGRYDFIQSTNVAGNLLDSLIASLCASDHMIWDGFLYPHMSGEHPYYCLGKGLFVKASDVRALGSWNPYITIEDPEAGLRFWKNGRKLGIIAAPLVEEVPKDFGGWLHQRNRWMCGFFQTLSEPLSSMRFTAKEKFLARLNLIPCLSLPLHTVGLPVGLWVSYNVLTTGQTFPWWIDGLSLINLCFMISLLTALYVVMWQRTRYVLSHSLARVWYLLRVNPIILLTYWMFWSIPIVIGYWMFLTDQGKIWRRTKKVDANHDLIRR
jgi:cellulose synthase/poly-beta-1,6-N-acetylglucosamine synthase-like glycosyltransferase